MLLLIDIFSINKGRGYENPSLEIIVTEHCSTGGFPLEEAREHFFLNQSVISIVVLISFMCYCGDYAGYITVILPFLAFYFCSAYFLYLVYFATSSRFSHSNTLALKNFKVFWPSVSLLTSHFRGHLLHTKMSHLSVAPIYA
jgi:hypothetical protein